MHLAVNTVSLYNIGPHVENLFGKHRFLATYVAAGIAGNTFSALLNPEPSVGASGAIFGLVGAYYVCLRRNQIFFGKSGQKSMTSMKKTMAMNVVIGLLEPSIDNSAHLGGLLGGAAMAYTFGPRLFLMDLPNSNRIVVDKARFRIPNTIKSFPETAGLKLQRLKRRMQVDRFSADLPVKLWQKRLRKR